MLIKHRSNFFLIFFLFSIYLIGWISQSIFLINWDNSWCLHAAEKLLSGGNYVSDFFDVNLPLTLYLYAFPHLIAKWFSLNIIVAFRIYIFVLCSISLLICYGFINKIFQNNFLLRNIFIWTLAFVFLVLPVQYFGEREHLLVIFTMPYILLLSTRMIYPSYELGKIPTILLTLFVGIGFVIKPYFVVTFFLLEISYAYHLRRFFNIFRLETITFFLFVIGYVICIFKFYPNFVHVIVPMVGKYFYSKGYSVDSWSPIIFNKAIVYCFSMLLFFLSMCQKINYKELCNTLSVGLVGFLFAYFIQGNAWTYHYLPALSMAILLSIFIFLSFFQISTKKMEKLFVCLIGILIFIYPINFLISNYQQGLIYKQLSQSLIEFMKTHTHDKTALFLTSNISFTLPSLDYSNTILASHFAHLAILPGILRIKKQNKPYLNSFIQDENFLIQYIKDDLMKKPSFVFIDTEDTNFFPRHFDYIQYLSKNLDFQKEWKNYRYFTTLEQKNIISRKFKILFYLFENNQSIDAEQIMHHHFFSDKIVLIGKDLQRSVILLHGNRIVKKINIQLTQMESTFFNQQKYGLIEKNNGNQYTLEKMEHKITYAAYPFYKVHVYQRI